MLSVGKYRARSPDTTQFAASRGMLNSRGGYFCGAPRGGSGAGGRDTDRQCHLWNLGFLEIAPGVASRAPPSLTSPPFDTAPVFRRFVGSQVRTEFPATPNTNDARFAGPLNTTRYRHVAEQQIDDAHLRRDRGPRVPEKRRGPPSQPVTVRRAGAHLTRNVCACRCRSSAMDLSSCTSTRLISVQPRRSASQLSLGFQKDSLIALKAIKRSGRSTSC